MVLSSSCSQGSQLPQHASGPWWEELCHLPQSAPHSPLVSPQPQVLEVRSLSHTEPTAVSEKRECFTPRRQERIPSPFTVLWHLSGRTGLPHRAAASGTADSTSLPAGFFAAVEAQVCEGSAGLPLDVEMEEAAAEVWAARSR